MKQLGIKITDNAREFISKVKQADAELEKLRKKKVDIQVQLDKKKDLQNQMRAIQAEITKINAKKLDIKVSTNNALSQIKEIEKRLASRTEKIQIRAEAGDVSAVSRLYKEIQDLEKKKIKLSVDVTEGRESIKRLNMDADELRAKKASIKVQADGIEETQQSLNAVDRQIRQINGQSVKIDLFSAGQSISKGAGYISDMTNSIANVSFAPIEAGARAAMSVIRQLSDTAKSLFNELEGDINMEKVFRQNQALLNVDTSETDAVYKELDKYSDRTIYNSAEMLNTYNALFNSGTKGTTKLVKGLGAIAATAADSKQAMSTLSLQFSQAMINGLQRTDLRYMAEATNGGLAVAFAQAGKDYEDFSRRLGVANEKTDPGIRTRLAAELEEVVRAAADNPEMNKLAETPKTISQGYEALTASLVNVTRKGFAPLQQVGINWLTKLSQDVEGLDKDKLVAFGNELADFADDKLAKLYDFIKNTDFKKLWSSFSDGFSDSMKDLSDSLGIYKTLFKNIFGLDDGELDIYNAANKIGSIVPKLVEYGIKFKEASLLFKGAAAGFDVFSTIARYANIKLPAGGLFSKLLGGGSNAASAITAPAINVNAFKTLAKGLGAVAGLAGTIVIGAKALQEVDEIKIGNNLPKKLAKMALAIAAMGGFATGVGALITAFPGGGAAALVGATTITALSATLAAAAKSIQTLDDVKVDGNYKEKVSKIGEVLGELAEVSGGLFANNLFSIIGNAGAMINDWLKGSQLKSFASMAESLNEIAEMPEINSKDINAKLRSVKEALTVLDEGENWHDVPVLSNLVDFFNAISSTFEAWKDKANAASIKSFADMFASLETLGGDFNPDLGKIKKNLKKIKDALSALNEEKIPDTWLDDVTSFIKGLGAKIDAFVSEANADKINSLVSVLKSFEAFEDTRLSPKKITKSMKNLKESVEAIQSSGISAITQVLKDGSFKDAEKATKSLKSTVEAMVYVAENAARLETDIDPDAIVRSVEKIKPVIKSLDFEDRKDMMKNFLTDEDISKVNHTVDLFIGMMERLKLLNTDIDLEQVGTTINELKAKIGLLSFGDGKKDLFKRFLTDEDISKVNHTVDLFIGMAERLKLLNNEIDLDKVGETINTLKAKIGLLAFGDQKEDLMENFLNDEDITKINHVVDLFIGMAERLNLLNIDLDLEKVGMTINNLKAKIGLLAFGGQKDEIFENLLTDEDIAKINHSVDLFVGLITKLQPLNQDIDLTKASQSVVKIREVLDQIDGVAAAEGLENVDQLIQKLLHLVETLNGLSGQFTPVGKSYAAQIVEGFQSVDLETPATSKVKALLNRLISMASYFTEAGRLAGNAYGQGLTSALSAIDVTSAGNSLGSQLKSSILSALSGLGSEIEQNIKATEIASRIASTISSATSSSSSDRDNNWTGGLIGGSTAFAGVDTIPINASQGEFMMPRKAVSKYGLNLMEAIRNLNFRMPTLPAMTPVPVQSVNTSNTDDHSQVTQIIKITGKSDAMTRLKASKYTRGLKK